ncbi:MAG: sn-glycerol-3-phosphate ABC transporter permease UgpA [Gammaproteobacteria bacterium]|nr:sn-glycerol-3-phosphate ABC transporter permease UgpA [Gammaproteobacteria bacterium]
MENQSYFQSRWLPYLLIFPQLLVVGVFFFWPSAQALMQVFYQQDPFGQEVVWVGWDNFSSLLSDKSYYDSLGRTFLFAGCVTVLGLVLGLLFAVLVHRIIRGKSIYRTLLIWPYAIAPVIAGVLWLFMFASPVGIVSYYLQFLGLTWNHLLNPTHALALIIMAAVWKQISYNFLFFLAGLQSIPQSLIEAAAIDGAGRFRRFFQIVLPILSPTTFFLVIINLVYAFFDTFAIIDATTHGGPGKSTSILVYKIYYDGFKALDIGSSAAQSVILMILVIALTFIQFKFVEKRVHYG